MIARSGTAGERGWLPWLLAAWVPALLFLAAVPLAARLTGHPVSLFTRDVFSVAEVPVYTALLSNAGVLLWCATATMCLFAAGALVETMPARRFYLGFGALSLAFLADDFFMLHEWIVPKVLGLPEVAVSAAYALALAGLLAVTRREVARREPVLLGIAVAWFAASILLDVVERVPAPAWHYLAEEGCKFFGIVTWAVYFGRSSFRDARASRRWTQVA